jgi:hypothetical protein
MAKTKAKKKKPAARKPARKPKKAVRKTVKKAARKAAVRKSPAAKPSSSAPKPSKRSPGKLAPGSGYQPAANETFLGLVDDYFAHVEVIALYLKDRLAVGDVIHVHGHTTDYTQRVDSMQTDHKPVTAATKGSSIGVKVGQKSRKGDRVFRVG